MYNEQFTLYSAIWTKYIYKTYTLKTGEDQTECGVYCEMSVETCNFFLIASGKCHLGRYDYYGSGTVLDSNVPTTYHKTSEYTSHFVLVTPSKTKVVFYIQVPLNHTFSMTSSGGLIKFMTGTDSYISMNTELTPGNVLLNVTTMTLVISMLMYIATVCMGVIHILEIQSLDGQTMSIFTTRKAKTHQHQSSPTTSMTLMEIRTNSCPITGTGEVESMGIILTRQLKSFVLSGV